MPILGVDYGRRRIGLAVSDSLGLTAQSLPTREVSGRAAAVAAVAGEAAAREAEGIVVGLPLDMDGGRGEMARAAEAFAEALGEAVSVPVVLWDERLTSAEARNTIRASGRGPKRKGDVDRVAAALLLDAYLRAARRRGEDGR